MAEWLSIPTEYNGRHFRSRMEATFARFLDALGIRWEYETRSFLLADGTHYLPDFWCPDLCLWVECRGYDNEKGRRQVAGFVKLLPSLVAQNPSRHETMGYLVVGDFDNGWSKCHLYDSASSDRAWAHVVPRCGRCGRAYFCGGDDLGRQCRMCDGLGEPGETFPLIFRAKQRGFLGVGVHGEGVDGGWLEMPMGDFATQYDRGTEWDDLAPWRKQQLNDQDPTGWPLQ